MRSNTIVPNDNSSRRPLHASLEILALGDVVIEELQQEVALLLLVPNDATGELWIDEECLLTGRRMCAHQWVDGTDRLATDNTTPVLAVISLLDSCSLVRPWTMR